MRLHLEAVPKLHGDLQIKVQKYRGESKDTIGKLSVRPEMFAPIVRALSTEFQITTSGSLYRKP